MTDTPELEREDATTASTTMMPDNGQKGGSYMLSVHTFHRIRQLDSEGRSFSVIARELGVDRRTVIKYLKSNSPPRYGKRLTRTREDPFVGFEDTARGLLASAKDLSATELYELLVAAGYTGSERTVDRRVAKIKGEKPKERYFEQEYQPGEQSQFDFKESVELPFVGGIKTVHLHFGTLPYSDVCFVRAYPHKTYECFIDGKHHFFEKIGGITTNVRIDNLSPCIKGILKGNRRIYTKAYKTATDHYGFGILPCAPGKGNEKGDVERDIRTYARRIKNRVQIEGTLFKDWRHLNEWLYEYMKSRLSDDKIARWKIEQAHLKPLPAWDDAVMCRIEDGPSSPYGTVRINKTAYSVPDTAIGVNCRAIMGPYEVKIYRVDGRYELVATHPLKPEGEPSILLEHVLPSLLRKPHALIRWAHRDLLFPDPVCRKFYARLKKIDITSAEREFLRSINLIQYVRLPEIIIGMELVLETDSQNLFDDLKSLLLGERRPAEVIDITSRMGQRPLKPELSQYDALIPNTKEGEPPDDARRTGERA